jgi:hypothetical protein
MTVTDAGISLSATHTAKQTYKREESLLVGFVSGGEGFSEENLSSGRRITRSQEQAEAFSDDSLLDRFQRGDNVNALTDTRTEYLSSLRALQAEFSAEAKTVSDSVRHAGAQLEGSPLAGTSLAGTLLPSAADTNAVESVVPSDVTLSAKDRARIELIVTIVEELTGKRIEVTDPQEFLDSRTVDTQLDPLTPHTAAVAPSQETTPESAPAPESGPVFGLRYSYQESYSESETTTFSAQGTVNTADGQEVSIDVSVTMSRSFSAEISESVEMGAALQDPLVVNYSGTAAELTERTFHFDIDADGTSDQIHFVKPGSGFLALDKNGDGQVNDGSELFGTQSGDGFADLAAYDEDGNGFIDGGDTVFEKLRVFVQDGAGNRQLAALGATGVEAIYLGHTSTPFEIKNERNELQGVVRETGIFVGEDGNAGTVQQIDLVV